MNKLIVPMGTLVGNSLCKKSTITLQIRTKFVVNRDGKLQVCLFLFNGTYGSFLIASLLVPFIVWIMINSYEH